MRSKLLLLFFSILLSSCVSYKITDPKISVNDITNLSYFEPLAFVGLIENNNFSTLNDSVSKISKTFLENTIVQSSNNKISKKILVKNPKTHDKINKELSYIFRKILNYNKINNVTTTPTIDSVLKSTKQKFVLATLVDGFVKTETNSKLTTIDDFNKPISTLDLLEPLPNKPVFTIHALIFDVINGKIIFYDHTNLLHKQPTNKKNIEKQYQKLFKGFYHN